MKNLRELLQELQAFVSDLKSKELLNDKYINSLHEAVASIREKSVHLEAIETNVEAIRSEIIKPIEARFKTGEKLGKLGVWVGIIGLVIGLAGIVYGTITTEVNKTSANKEFKVLRISTGTPDGVYFPMGVAVSSILMEKMKMGIGVQINPSEGSLDNLEKIQNGTADLAIVQNDVFVAASKDDAILNSPLPFKATAICNLYDEPLQIIVRNDGSINSLSDLKDKKINVGLPKSGINFTSKRLLDLYFDNSSHSQYDEVPLIDAISKIAMGEIQAIFIWRALPAPNLNVLIQNGKFKILSLSKEDIRKLKGDTYAEIIIAPGTYSNQSVPINTLSVKALLICSRDLKSEEVFNITDGISRFGKDIDKSFKLTSSVPSGRDMIVGLPASSLHEGVKKFFNIDK